MKGQVTQTDERANTLEGHHTKNEKHLHPMDRVNQPHAVRCDALEITHLILQ